MCGRSPRCLQNRALLGIAGIGAVKACLRSGSLVLRLSHVHVSILGSHHISRLEHFFKRVHVDKKRSSDSGPTAMASEERSDPEGNKVYKSFHHWQTRLIEFLPGEVTDPLRCNFLDADVIALEGLAIAKRDLRVDYEAIS
jgi:hypothetical protein